MDHHSVEYPKENCFLSMIIIHRKTKLSCFNQYNIPFLYNLLFYCIMSNLHRFHLETFCSYNSKQRKTKMRKISYDILLLWINSRSQKILIDFSLRMPIRSLLMQYVRDHRIPDKNISIWYMSRKCFFSLWTNDYPMEYWGKCSNYLMKHDSVIQ